MSRLASTYVLRVHFLRHAESHNNANRHDDDDKKPAAEGNGNGAGAAPAPPAAEASPPAKKRKRERHPDPGITPRGHDQAWATAHYLARRMKDSGDDLVPGPNPGLERVTKIYTSAMTRALQTAKPATQLLGEKFGVETVVWPEIHESGGCFRGDRKLEGFGQCMAHGRSVAGVREIIGPGAQVKPEEFRYGADGGWWPGGFEAAEASVRRAAVVVRGIWDMALAHARAAYAEPEAAPSACKADAVVVVVHGNFFSIMLRHILGVPAQLAAKGHEVPSFLTGNCAITTVDFHVKLEQADEEYPEMRAGVVGMNSQEHLPFELRTGHNLQGCVFKPVPIAAAAADGTPAGAGAADEEKS